MKRILPTLPIPRRAVPPALTRCLRRSPASQCIRSPLAGTLKHAVSCCILFMHQKLAEKLIHRTLYVPEKGKCARIKAHKRGFKQKSMRICSPSISDASSGATMGFFPFLPFLDLSFFSFLGLLGLFGDFGVFLPGLLLFPLGFGILSDRWSVRDSEK